jgi:LysM repeat protein
MAIFETYTVQSGDTLSKIARRFGTNVDSIAAWSGLKNKNVIVTGQQLNVRQVSELYYIVQSGDTLSRIAARYNVSVDELRRANDIPDASRISVGARLVVPTARQGPTAAAASPARRLGSLSKAYEVSSGGPGTVSKGRGDHGGVSYGSYQLSSKFNRPAEFLAAEGKPWAARFAGHEQGSAGFSKVWKAIAAREPERFYEAQHAYIKRTHYDVQVRKIAARTGLDVNARSRALQDVVWSAAVQHGPSSSLIAKVVAALGQEPSDPGFDKALIMAIYGERGRRDADGRLHHFRSSSDDFQDGVARRFGREVKDALDMLAAEQALGAVAAALPQPAANGDTAALDIAPAPVARAAGDSAAEAVRRAPGKLTDDDVRLILEKYGDAEANAEFLAGQKVLVSLRKSTNTRKYRKGLYDDLLLIVQRQADGSVKLQRMPINTEPAGEYAFDGSNKNRAKYGNDTDRDGRKELGRLVAGTYHYARAPGRFLGAEYFQSRNIQVTERDTNQDGDFEPGAGDNIDPGGAGRTMHIHRGGAEGVATWSAGCQTVPKNRYPAFLAALKGQDKLSYILINAG